MRVMLLVLLLALPACQTFAQAARDVARETALEIWRENEDDIKENTAAALEAKAVEFQQKADEAKEEGKLGLYGLLSSLALALAAGGKALWNRDPKKGAS